ncbi:MAG TPA: hypothetical protein GX521_04785 [Firmicutes bacterium]|nr:hypothetical protein [Bacillota bacterium]
MLDLDQGAAAAPEIIDSSAKTGRLRKLLVGIVPGVAASVLVALLSVLMGHFIPVVGASVLALGVGLAINASQWGLPPARQCVNGQPHA